MIFSSQFPLEKLAKALIIYSTFRLTISVFRAVCEWYAEDGEIFVPSSLKSELQNLPTEILSLRITMTWGSPLLRYTWFLNMLHTQGTFALGGRGFTRINLDYLSKILKGSTVELCPVAGTSSSRLHYETDPWWIVQKFNQKCVINEKSFDTSICMSCQINHKLYECKRDYQLWSGAYLEYEPITFYLGETDIFI